MVNNMRTGMWKPQLKVTVVRASDLPPRSIRRTKFLVRVSHGHQIEWTDVIKGDLNPLWNKEFSFAVTNHPSLIFEVYDKHRFKDDRLVGSVVQNVEEFMEAATSNPRRRMLREFSCILQMNNSSSGIAGTLNFIISTG